MMNGSCAVAIWALLSVTGAAPEAPRPWENATPEQKQAAKVLFDAGVREMFSLRFANAAQDFREAIKQWDLPVFHRNLAAALRGLTDFVEAREQLLIALQYGPEGMADDNEFKKTQNDLADVEAELSRLAFTCDQEGAKVTIDGNQDSLVCPQTHEEWIKPGRHTLRIQLDRPGYSRPDGAKLNLVKGERVAVNLRVRSDEELKVSPLPTWVPWTVAAAGVAISAGGGGLLHYQALLSVRDYDESIGRCADTRSPAMRYICPPEETAALAPIQQGANRWKTGALISYIGGGALVVTGAVLFVINRPHLPPMPQEVTVMPVLTPGSVGVALAVGF